MSSDFKIPEGVLQRHPELEGQALRDEAMERVYNAADPEVKADARRAIRVVAERQTVFTSDDVWQEMTRHPEEPRVLGPLMRWAQSEGICERTDSTVLSELPQNHRRPIRVWKSLVVGEGTMPKTKKPLTDEEILLKWPRVSPGYGFICTECRCPVDSYVRGNHDPGCSRIYHNEGLMEGREEFVAFQPPKETE